MNIYEVTFAMVGALDQLAIDYVLVGGIATMFHGYSRTTEDADFVIGIESERRLVEVASLLGPDYRLNDQTTFEVYTSKTYRTIHIGKSPLKIDIFFAANDPFDREQFARCGCSITTFS